MQMAHILLFMAFVPPSQHIPPECLEYIAIFVSRVYIIYISILHKVSLEKGKKTTVFSVFPCT